MSDREEFQGGINGSRFPSPNVDVVPSGSLRLDIALRLGGIPRGRICEFYGPPSSGKTTICQHIIAEAQSLGEICAFIDADHTLDVRYAQRCGVDLDRLIVSEPMDAEQALQIVQTITRSGAASIVVVDSISTLIPEAEMAAELTKSSGTSVNPLLSRTLQKLVPVIQRTKSTLLFTNRTYPKRVIYHKLKENPARLALKMHAAVLLKLTPMAPIQIRNKICGQTVRVQIVKNSLAPCFVGTELDIMYNEGVNKTGEIFDLGKELAIIEQKGSSYSYRALKLGSGRETAIKSLEQDATLAREIEQVIRQRLIPPFLNPSS